MRLKPAWRPGFLVPLLLALTCFADVALRVLPIDGLTFRPWEAVRRFRPYDETFEPNQVRFKANSYGGLASIGNLPALRQYRPERFTTDALGYRNAPEIAWAAAHREPEVAAILVGSSMSTGVGNSDEETLAVQLSALTGRTVYNASLTVDLISLERIRRVAQHFGLRSGLVIFEYLEASDLPPPGSEPQPDACFRLVSFLGLRQFDPACSLAYGLVRVSPLRILAEQAYRRLQDDRLLPNVHARVVAQRRLRNGTPMLFQRQIVDEFDVYRSEDPEFAYLTWLAAELERDNLDLLVVLVPTSYTVYRPLLAEPPPAPPFPPYLERLEGRLRAAGVPVVNLTAPFMAQAERDLPCGQYIYWRDDHHWNARGIALAAREIRRAWDVLPAAPPSEQAPSTMRVGFPGRAAGEHLPPCEPATG